MAVGDGDRDRVDHPLGDLVADLGEVADPHLASLADGVLEQGPGGLLVGALREVDLDVLGHPDALSGGSRDLGQCPFDHGALLGAAALPQCTESDHQGGGLGAVEPQRSAEVVGVGEPDDVLALEGVEVDVDEVAHARGRGGRRRAAR